MKDTIKTLVYIVLVLFVFMNLVIFGIKFMTWYFGLFGIHYDQCL